MDRLSTPHDYSRDCGDDHCASHGVDEPDVGAYLCCLECGHAFPTAQALVEAYNADSKRMSEFEHGQGFDVPYVPATDAEAITFCPFCYHDW